MRELTNNTGTAFDVQLRRLELVNKVCLTSKIFMLQLYYITTWQNKLKQKCPTKN